MTPAATNPEQVCPRSPSGKSHAYATNGDECLMCGTGRVAAKPDYQDLDPAARKMVNEKFDELIWKDPAPVDKPDEQPRKIGTVFGEDVYMLPAAHKRLMASGVMDNRKDTFDFVGNPDAAAILASERKAAATEARIDELKNVRKMTTGTDGAGFDQRLLDRLAALTKGETNGK